MKCPACNGVGGGELSMGGPTWECNVCHGTGQGSDPVHTENGQWYFWDETQADRYGPYATEREARCTLEAYAAQVLDCEKWIGPLAIPPLIKSALSLWQKTK